MTRPQRIKRLTGAAALCALGLATALYAQQTTTESVGEHIAALTAPAMEGRGNRTEGLDAAREYIIEEMKRAGLEPAGDEGFEQPVEVVVDARPSRDVELRLAGRVLAQKHQYEVAGFSGGGPFEGAVVFAGYGISAPTLGWDDYANLDVRGDVVVILTGEPDPEQLSLDALFDHHLVTPQSKAAVALAQGASAAIIVNDPDNFGDSSDQHPDVLPEFWPENELEDISVAFMTARAAEDVLGADFAERRNTLRTSPTEARGPLGATASGNLTLDRQVRTLYNVVGRAPGAPQSGAPLVVGAHYDGLGVGEPGSLVDPDDLEQVHPGADDNASGVAVMLEVADTVVANELTPHRPVLFAALVSEELGMRGSRVMAGRLRREHPPGTMINMDMVGRMNEQTLYAAIGEDAGRLAKAVESAAANHGVGLKLEGLRERRSDHVSFAEAGYDAVSLSTGRHVDYHMPTDTPDQLNRAGMARVHDVLVDIVEQLTIE
ncbi:MAG: M20/M25/M40 family metallo-hydrolase [Myxococcota bacterium]